jgi:hypothetical protein
MNMYRNCALVGCLLAGIGASTSSAQQADANQKKPAVVAAPAPSAVPAGAVQTGPGTWSYTDPKGTKWIYRQTPWGLSRAEDVDKSVEKDPAKAAAQAEMVAKEIAATHASRDADVIRFERPGPFGMYRWTRKPTELTPVEQAAWDRDRAGKSDESGRE